MDQGFGEEKVLATIRVASVLHAIASVFDNQRVAPGQPVDV